MEPSLSKPPITRIITWLPVGGIERRLVSVLPRLRERGWPVRLVCVREYGPLAEELRERGIPVDLVPFRSRLDPKATRRLAGLMRETGTKLVHSHMYRSNVPGTRAGRKAGVPVIFGQIHNVDTWESKRQAFVDRWLAQRRTGTICVSRAVQDDVCATLKLPREKAPILYNGSDTEVFRPDDALRESTRAVPGLEENELLFLVPARIHKNKNPLGVLRAFLSARQKISTPVRLMFAGGGPMEEELRAAVKRAAAEDVVTLLGKRDDMPALYNAADVVILSSFKEGFSNAVVEALACGRPVIAARVGGNAEALDRPEVGWLHEAGDEEALAAQIAEAASDPAGLRARSEACRERGLVFSLDQLVEDTDALYTRALKEAGVL